jgi:hypothetical protein
VIWNWFKPLFGRRSSSKTNLQRRLVVLDQQQARWKERVRQAEREKQQLLVRGSQTADQRVKVDCARRLFQLDTSIKDYDGTVAQLEVQKNNVLALVRAIEAREMAADVAEVQRGEQEIERLTQEVRLSQQRLEEARGTIRVVEGGRLESAPEEAPEVQAYLRVFGGSTTTTETPPRLEKE